MNKKELYRKKKIKKFKNVRRNSKLKDTKLSELVSLPKLNFKEDN